MTSNKKSPIALAEQQYFNAFRGLVRLRYVAGNLALLSDFIKADLYALKDKNIPDVQMKLLFSKANSIDYYVEYIDTVIRPCFPQGGDTKYCTNRFFSDDAKGMPEFSLADPPPEPYDLEKDENLQLFLANVRGKQVKPSEFIKHGKEQLCKTLNLPNFYKKFQQMTVFDDSDDEEEEVIENKEEKDAEMPATDSSSSEKDPIQRIATGILRTHLGNDDDGEWSLVDTNDDHNNTIDVDGDVGGDDDSNVLVLSNSGNDNNTIDVDDKMEGDDDSNVLVGSTHGIDGEQDIVMIEAEEEQEEDYQPGTAVYAITRYLKAAENHKQDRKNESAQSVLDKMIQTKIVPVKRTSFYATLKAYKHRSQQKVSVKDFNWVTGKQKPGRPRLVSNKDLAKVFGSGESKKTIRTSDVQDKLTEIKRANAQRRGYVPQCVPKATLRTAKHYKNMCALSSNFRIQEGIHFKNERRRMAERSSRSALSFLFTQAASHYIVSKVPFNERDMKKLPKIKDASPGAKFLYKLIQHCNKDMYISIVHPALNLSTDDSTVYALNGVEEDKQEWVLVPNKDNCNDERNRYSSYSSDKDKCLALGGIRVRITVTTSACGAIAPPFITIYGLTARHLPPERYPDGVHIEKIPGLCVGGNQDINCKGKGFLVFARTKGTDDDTEEVTPDTTVLLKYRYILMEFLRDLKTELYGDTLSEEDGFEEKFLSRRSVAWCDGCGTQVAVLRNTDLLDDCRIQKVCLNKHSKSRTTVEQSLDVGPIFKVVKKVNKSTTTNDCPLLLFQAKMENEIDRIEKDAGISLGRKKSAIVDFLTMLPTVFMRSMTPKNVVAGFLGNGMIDEKSYTYPDYFSIINTCKNPIIRTQDMQETIIKNFKRFYDEQCSKGMISEDTFSAYGIPPDLHSDGRQDRTFVSSRNEMCHRAKCMSHEFQQDERLHSDENPQSVQKSITSAQLEKFVAKTSSYHHTNKDAEEQLFKKIPPPHNVNSLSTVTRRQLFPLNVPLLTAFTFVRIFDKVQHGSNLKKLNKGKLQEVENGAESIVNQAYAVRDKKVILETADACRERLKKFVIEDEEANNTLEANEDRANDELLGLLETEEDIQMESV